MKKYINIFITLVLCLTFLVPDKTLALHTVNLEYNDHPRYKYDPKDNGFYILGASLLQQSNPDTWGIIAQNRTTNTKTVVMTAYSSTPDQTDDTPFITASNTHVRDGIVAANFLRFGTRIKIPELFGDKVFVVEDRMHTRFSERVDIWFETRQEAKNFGVKYSEIVVLY